VKNYWNENGHTGLLHNRRPYDVQRRRLNLPAICTLQNELANQRENPPIGVRGAA
jgi:hypothetical protein